jgi:DNA-binding LacI/PurR family transcriptional regulator
MACPGDRDSEACAGPVGAAQPSAERARAPDEAPVARRSGSRPPTIREVALLAGVSPMTVSRVLTGRGYVADETAGRVRAAFQQLGYRPNPAARLLRGRRSHLIGVTIPSLTSSVHRGIVAGVEEIFEATEYQVILGHLQAGLHPSSDFVKVARHRHCDGYVMVPSRADASSSGVASLDRPAVVALSSIPGQVADAVLVDGRDAARSATGYLIDHFGPPVAYVGLDSRLSHDLSILDGYREGMAAAGLEPWELSVHSGEDGAHQGVRAMLSGPRPPRAILFASTQVHLEGLGALVQSGLRIGQDVGVVAVASEERPWTALLPSSIGLLVIPAREIGRRAATRLLQRISAPSDEVQTEVVQVELLLPRQPDLSSE